jgi:hypothetical protein
MRRGIAETSSANSGLTSSTAEIEEARATAADLQQPHARRRCRARTGRVTRCRSAASASAPAAPRRAGCSPRPRRCCRAARSCEPEQREPGSPAPRAADGDTRVIAPPATEMEPPGASASDHSSARSRPRHDRATGSSRIAPASGGGPHSRGARERAGSNGWDACDLRDDCVCEARGVHALAHGPRRQGFARGARLHGRDGRQSRAVGDAPRRRPRGRHSVGLSGSECGADCSR